MFEYGAPGKIATGIFGWLLRLYPSGFRDRYGDDAMQLFRDRYGDERGIAARTRLWLDLLRDFRMSVAARPWRQPSGAMAMSAQADPAGIPSFRMLEGESLRAPTMLSGGAMSVVAFGLCWILMSQWQFRAWAGQHGDARAAQGTPAGVGGTADPATATGVSIRIEPRIEPRRIVEEVARNLEQSYVDRDAGRRTAQALLARKDAGAYDRVTDGRALAAKLTNDLRELTRDGNLIVQYSSEVLPGRPAGPSASAMARYREAMLAENCMIRKVEMLPGRVGYLKLDSFPDPSVCEVNARNAMARLNGADALIIDLRDNGGGYPAMVALVASYLFDHPEYLYNPREATTANSWTRSPVAGSRLADKAVFILISGNTRSGAEQFSYDLKMLKRATLVGEKTGGAEHSGVYHRLDEHFGMGIPEAGPINPYGNHGWEGVGVEPDVKVNATEALGTAGKLAAKKALEVEALRRMETR